jgi:O-antigen ligase
LPDIAPLILRASSLELPVIEVLRRQVNQLSLAQLIWTFYRPSGANLCRWGRQLKLITVDHKHFARLTDALAIALAISLPWSTSATGILAALWLLALIPTLELRSLRRVFIIPAGGLPALLVVLGGMGMLWADVPWGERLGAMSSFVKLLFIPLFLQRFYRSDAGRQVLIGFLGSCVALLVVSWSRWLVLSRPGTEFSIGIPVKDYIAQGAMFTICSLVIVRLAYDKWNDGHRRVALALIALAVLFFLNVLYIATSRTYLVAFPLLLVVFGYQQFGWKGAIGLVVGCVVFAMAVWPSAPFLRLRVSSFVDEIRLYQRTSKTITSAGQRLGYWSKSVSFIREAPLLGHGTGSIGDQFRRSAIGQFGIASEVSDNPHNQTLAIGIQIGLVGIAVLLAMWAAHLALFQGNSFAAWVGLVVVMQNIISSLFNSHLFDFTHGWAYVIGVGIAGGTALKESGAWSQRKHNSNS